MRPDRAAPIPRKGVRLFSRIELLACGHGRCEAEKQEVLAAGGLHIVGTERHESRRIDNQLRGRTGRQGDPGSSRFYLSLEDDLLRIFGSERISSIMEKLGMEEGIPIEHKMITRSIENAQKKVEAHHFDIRKQLLEYDDVMNKQRGRETCFPTRLCSNASRPVLTETIDTIRRPVWYWTSSCSKMPSIASTPPPPSGWD